MIRYCVILWLFVNCAWIAAFHEYWPLSRFVWYGFTSAGAVLRAYLFSEYTFPWDD